MQEYGAIVAGSTRCFRGFSNYLLFGRLVRSHADRGSVVILDDRILRKRYGVYLRESLPPAPLIKGSWSELARVMSRFHRGDTEQE